MDVKNLLGKLHAQDETHEHSEPPNVPSPPTPKNPVQRVALQQTAAHTPVIEERMPVQQTAPGGRFKMREDLEEGIILDLGEGISLNIPIQRRMSLSDFIKLAEKVKALEMISESSEMYKKEQF